MHDAGLSSCEGLYRTTDDDDFCCELRLDGMRAVHRIHDHSGGHADRFTRGEYTVDGTGVRVRLEPVAPPMTVETLPCSLDDLEQMSVIELRLTPVLDPASRHVCRLTADDGTVYSRIEE